MAEYIEREAAIKAVSGWYRKALHPENMSSYNEGERAAYRTALSEIANLPAADVRPVVRCGECKHWFENGTDYCSCDRDALLRERDFFCAAGEKREES